MQWFWVPFQRLVKNVKHKPMVVFICSVSAPCYSADRVKCLKVRARYNSLSLHIIQGQSTTPHENSWDAKSLKAVLPSTLEKRWPEDCAINLKSDISKSISQFSSFSCFCSNGVLSGSLVWLLYTLLSSSINLVWECARMHLAHSQDFFPEEQTLREETFHFFVLSVKCECDSTKRENSVLSASQTSSLHAPQSAANSRNVDVLKNFKLESIRHFEYISSNKLLL